MPRSCDPFRQNYKRLLVETFFDKYSDLSDENLFLSIGKITPWGDTDVRTASVDSVKDDTDFWRGLIAAKRINRTDVSLVARRVDWTSGTIYQPYRDTIDLYDDDSPSDFYVLVDEERVYLCIDNNDGAQSFSAPNHTDSVIRKLSDGYRWKFLYQIPESKRKFLTKTNAGAVGYMPVEYVETLKTNDDRKLQWNVQQAAVNGHIDFAYLDPAAKLYWVSDESCLLPADTNTIAQTVAAGATSARIYSPNMSASTDIYKNMMLTIEAGAGQGQRRKISKYEYVGPYGVVDIDELSIGLSGPDSATNQSKFSITPVVSVVGDGFASSDTNNPTIKTADFVLKFGSEAAVGDQCSSLLSRYVNSVEVVDGGYDYTFATLSVSKGIQALSTTPSEYADFNNLIHAVMPPPGGHGSNPVKELGVSALMIVKDFSQDENGGLNVDNDYRQFGIVRNPLLQEPQVRIKFYGAGVSGTFAVGGTAGQVNGPVGTVLEWCAGKVGHTATSELVLGDIRGGSFSAGGVISGLTIFDVSPKTVAGTEGRHLLDLTLASQNSQFSSVGDDYNRNYFAYGVGNQGTNVPQSRASGQIYCWSLNPATDSYGTLSIEDPKGEFSIGEMVLSTDPYFSGSNGVSGPGKITAMETRLVNMPTIYDITTSLTISGSDFTTDTFPVDSHVYFSTGSTAGNGYVIDWTIPTGTTSGTLRLSGVQGTVLTGQNIDYWVMTSGTTGTVSATISDITHQGELKYRSGEVLYIQNVNPITRDIEQREEIKLVIEL